MSLLLEKVFSRLLKEVESQKDYTANLLNRMEKTKDKIGLLISPDDLGAHHFVLFDVLKFKKSVISSLEDASEGAREGYYPSTSEVERSLLDRFKNEAIILAYIYLTPPEDPCNNAKVVQLSAKAGDGWGSIIYDMAATWSQGGIISHRSSVKSKAEDVYKIFGRRNDIEKKDLDDVLDPKTPPPQDDCILQPENRPALNKSYKSFHTSQLTSLTKASSDAITWASSALEEALGLENAKNTVVYCLEQRGNDLFEEKY